jgi:integrase/recombinase XerD
LYYFITFYLNQQGTELAKTFLYTVENFSSSIYKQLSDAKTAYQKRNALRDTIVIELLFATEMRISKLYSLDVKNVSLYDRTILIYEKGSKKSTTWR